MKIPPVSPMLTPDDCCPYCGKKIARPAWETNIIRMGDDGLTAVAMLVNALWLLRKWIRSADAAPKTKKKT